MDYRFIIWIVLIICCLSACKTEEEILTLEEGSIELPFHQENIGKVLFLEEPISKAEFAENQFLSSVVLSDNMDMNAMLFLEKTLTYYQHQLAPELSVNQLCKQGNFHITFYVDGNKIYEEALIPGAGSCWFKNTTTLYRLPLLSSEDEDSWARFLWMRFMKREGGEEALSEGAHTLKMEFRPYVEVEAIKVGDIIAEGAVEIQISNREVSEQEIALQPIAPNSGWKQSEGEFDKEKIRTLNKKIAQQQYKDITSLVVLKNGELLIEEYFNDAGRKSLHDTRSVGKTFASAVAGIAINEGYIGGVDTKISTFYDLRDFKNYSSDKEEITIEHLLTMSSNFSGSDMNPDSPGNEENMYPTADWVKFGLDLPLDQDRTSGASWDYFTAGVVLLGDIIEQSVPGGLEDYSKMKLFGPMKVDQYKWQYTPQNVPNTAGGLEMTSLDLARFGQLYKAGGVLNDRQVLPSEWVEKSLSRQIDIPDSVGGGSYGYLFWIKEYVVDGTAYEVAYASGNGGNKIFIFRDLPYVIVVTATAYNQPYAHLQVDKMMEQQILPALLSK